MQYRHVGQERSVLMRNFMKSKVLSIVLSLLMAFSVFAPGARGAQHDFDITTADANTGATMRIQINAALQALAGLSSGAAAPVTLYPYQLWADTTTGKLKMRNAGNTAWITLWSFSSGPITTVSTQVFTTSGTYTAPTGLAYAIVEVVSGGGGGGAGDATPHSGGGGGGGGYARAILTAATIGASQTVTIGNGGAGGIYGGIGAASGGTTSFGSYLSATGGGGGNPIIGGLGGVGLGGSVNCSGSPGANEMGTSNIAGDGGSSMMGGGGKGSYGTTNAMQGGNYGGGGGGGGAVASYGNGNNGAPGIVIVTEFKTQ